MASSCHHPFLGYLQSFFRLPHCCPQWWPSGSVSWPVILASGGFSLRKELRKHWCLHVRRHIFTSPEIVQLIAAFLYEPSITENKTLTYHSLHDSTHIEGHLPLSHHCQLAAPCMEIHSHTHTHTRTRESYLGMLEMHFHLCFEISLNLKWIALVM